MTDTAQSHAAHDEHHVHALPMRVLLATFVLLLILTAATVAVWKIDLGSIAILVSLGIALIKAAAVALYFMHLRYDSLFNGIILICALLFVVIFIAISLLDSHEYQPGRLEYRIQNPVPSGG